MEITCRMEWIYMQLFCARNCQLIDLSIEISCQCRMSLCWMRYEKIRIVVFIRTRTSNIKSMAFAKRDLRTDLSIQKDFQREIGRES